MVSAGGEPGGGGVRRGLAEITPDQPAAVAIQWLWSFRRLWVVAISRHSENAAPALPAGHGADADSFVPSGPHT
jgi:hypothetical protein